MIDILKEASEKIVNLSIDPLDEDEVDDVTTLFGLILNIQSGNIEKEYLSIKDYPPQIQGMVRDIIEELL